MSEPTASPGEQMMDALDEAQKIAELLAGMRTVFEAQGFSPTASEQMVQAMFFTELSNRGNTQR